MTIIVNAEPTGYSPIARAVLASAGTIVDGSTDHMDLRRTLVSADVLIVRLGVTVDRALLEAAPRLRVIVSATTGLDHIDLTAAAEHNVRVLSLRGATEFLQTLPATAEHTWALLLALVRDLPAAVRDVQLGEWRRDRFRGRELRGLRLGLLGLGRIGRMVARYGQAFGMQVVACDPNCESWPTDVARVNDAAALFAQSDVISLHLPLTPETIGMVNAPLLSVLPPRALLVNTARGELIDEVALVAALESGALAGAALDVVHHERDAARRRASGLFHYLQTHHNVIVTPHLGGATEESMARAEEHMARELVAYLTTVSALGVAR